MPSPFYNAIKGTTSGAPGAGAFTPNAAASGFRAWSNVPAGWIGMARFEDGTDWELSFSYWNGTTLSRGTNQLFDSSTGSVLTLSSSATAALIAEADEFGPHPGGVPIRGFHANCNSTTLFNNGSVAPTSTGTVASAGFASTNYLTLQPRIQVTSATTAGAIAGYFHDLDQRHHGVTSGSGGLETRIRWGASQLPTGYRAYFGMGSAGMTVAAEPAASGAHIAFVKEAADTNLWFITRQAALNRVADTGIPIVVNGWYETIVWVEPGSSTAHGLLMRLDTGAIWYGKTSTNVPNNNADLSGVCQLSVGTTAGTAAVLHVGSMYSRIGS